MSKINPIYYYVDEQASLGARIKRFGNKGKASRAGAVAGAVAGIGAEGALLSRLDGSLGAKAMLAGGSRLAMANIVHDMAKGEKFGDRLACTTAAALSPLGTIGSGLGYGAGTGVDAAARTLGRSMQRRYLKKKLGKERFNKLLAAVSKPKAVEV